jgi:hypothetical protein
MPENGSGDRAADEMLYRRLIVRGRGFSRNTRSRRRANNSRAIHTALAGRRATDATPELNTKFKASPSNTLMVDRLVNLMPGDPYERRRF